MPAIITFIRRLPQEVRLDTNFNMKLRKKAQATGRTYTTAVGGQVEHLLSFIGEVCEERSRDAPSGSLGGCADWPNQAPYQIVYQPAMLLQEMSVLLK